jgi:putative pyruvate formate lyase activating enzyme
LGFCGQSNLPRLALATLHRGEEPPLCGAGGSGAVFFSGCTLKCVFCQNCDISNEDVGREIDGGELAAVFLELQRRGAGNVNLVTGTHFFPSIAESMKIAVSKGFKLPVLWNSSGFENSDGLEIIESFADVYLPDLKTLDGELARMFFNAPGYPKAAAAAVRRMAACSAPVFDEAGMLVKGTIVRHLVLPGYLENTRDVLTWFANNLKDKALLSVMFQYLPPRSAPPRRAGPATGDAPSRIIEDAEYYSVVGMLEELGIDDGFVQEPEADSPWFPDFTKDNPFPDDFSSVVWHWKQGWLSL